MRLKTLVFAFLMTTAFNAQAQNIGESSFNRDTARSFSFVFGNSYSKDPIPLGVDFNIELQTGAISAPESENNFDSELWFTNFTVRKGIYWNLLLSLSFLTPINDSIQSGFSAGIGHTQNFKFGHLSSSLYVFSYNVGDNINQRGAGLSSILYFKTSSFYTGFGFGGEDLTSEMQGTSSTNTITLKAFTYRALASLLYTYKKHRISIDGSYLDSKNYLASLNYGIRL